MCPQLHQSLPGTGDPKPSSKSHPGARVSEGKAAASRIPQRRFYTAGSTSSNKELKPIQLPDFAKLKKTTQKLSKFASWLHGTSTESRAADCQACFSQGVTHCLLCEDILFFKVQAWVFHFTQTAEKIQQTFVRLLGTGARRGCKSFSGLCCPKAGSAFTDPLLRKSVPFM